MPEVGRGGVSDSGRGGVPEVVTGGVPGQAMDAASHDCIALRSAGGEVDVRSVEEQSEEVQKVCTSWTAATALQTPAKTSQSAISRKVL